MSTERSDLRTRIREQISRYYVSVLALLFLILLWQFGGPMLNTGDVQLIPTWGDIIQDITVEFEEQFEAAFTSTVLHVFGGFIAASIFGIFAGMLLAEIKYVRLMTLPSLLFSHSVPSALLAPLFLIWFGTGSVGIIAFATWGASFPIIINTLTGMQQTGREFEYMGEMFGASRWQQVRYIRFWNALPHIVGGMKIGIHSTVVGVILIEFFASGSGLAFQIRTGAQFIEPGLMWGAVFTLMVLAFVIFVVFRRFIEHVTPPGVVE